jgi:hypothetical protein
MNCERARVVLDRRDVVDRLAEPLVEEPLKRLPLDVDEVGDLQHLLQAGERAADAGSVGLAQVPKPPGESEQGSRFGRTGPGETRNHKG